MGHQDFVLKFIKHFLSSNLRTNSNVSSNCSVFGNITSLCQATCVTGTFRTAPSKGRVDLKPMISYLLQVLVMTVIRLHEQVNTLNKLKQNLWHAGSKRAYYCLLAKFLLQSCIGG